jgi:hypothetical protein
MEKTWQEIAILIILLIFFVGGIIGIFAARKSLTGAQQPSVSVNLDDTTYTDKSSISVTGKADNAKTVTVNGQEVQTDKDGNFSASVSLNNGENKLAVVAKNDSKQAEANKTVVKEENKGVAGTSTGQAPAIDNNLNQSGPTENIGMVGLAAIFLSLVYYFEKKKGANSPRFNLYKN